MRVAIAHDYLTQRGGAERVLLSILKAFPGAPLNTSLYDAERTFPEFRDADVRTLPLDRLPVLRRHHRLALPLLAPAFSRLQVEADVLVCTSSGWAHGTRATGAKVVYCYAPARWLYQSERYLGGRGVSAAAALRLLRPALLRWDRRAALDADRYVTSSRAMQTLIREAYGRDAEVLAPPQTVDPTAPQRPIDRVEPGFFLCVSRLLPYKNLDVLVEAFAELRGERLVIAGGGPDEARLRAAAPANVRLLGMVSDDELRWLYASCRALVAASYEDFGLTPLEAAAFGRPAAVLRYGGFVDTVREGETGIFFDRPAARKIRSAVLRLGQATWSDDRLRSHAATYAEEFFVERLRRIAVEAVAAKASLADVPDERRRRALATISRL